MKSGRPPMGNGQLDSKSEKSLVLTNGGLLNGIGSSGSGSGASFKGFKSVSSELCRSGYLRSLCWLLCHERECIRSSAGNV